MRLTFSEETTTTEYKTDLEAATNPTFRNYGNRSAFNLFDHTDAGLVHTYSQLLNGGNNSQVGLAKSFAVNPGDVFDLEVYAKYEAPASTGNNVNNLVTALIPAFNLSSAGTTPLDGQQALNAFNNTFTAGPYIGRVPPYEDGAAPKAYLNYILFDENFVLVDFGFDQISNSAQQTGTTPVPHDYLNLHVKVGAKGYLYIYLSNEQAVQTNVYFDDFKIKYTTAIQQVQDYYPFGLTFNSYQRENSTPNDYKYNGKEEQDELDLGWVDHGARMYQPDIGRWNSLDPSSESYFTFSPYNYVRNSPIVRIDPNGQWDITVHLYNDREQYGYGVAIVTDRHGNEVYRFNVRAEGTAGRNRMVTNSDTPLGVYDIPDGSDPNDPTWRSGGDRAVYGPNPRLTMHPESGEILESGRDNIRVHGGRQEIYDAKTKTWTPVTNPRLKKTYGCLRAFDTDMVALKQITDDLEANDELEKGGKVTVVDDLEKGIEQKSEDNVVEVKVTYRVPSNEIKFWQDLVRELLNGGN